MAEKGHGHLDEEELTCTQKIALNWKAFKDFMWDPQQKTFMGRNARSWAEIGVFYLFYYGFLAAFFGSLLAIFYYGFIDQTQPTYTDKIGTPGLMHYPRYKNEENIAFNLDNENTYKKFTDDIDELLDLYRNQNDTVYENCPSGPSFGDVSDRLCKFELSDLGEFCTSPKYGYDIGQPCVYFSLNKVWGWQPKAYKNESVPDAWRDRWDPNYILFECKGRKDKDQENLGITEFYPAAGVDFKYFPYTGDTNKNSHYRVHYLTPLVAMRFRNITQDTTVRIKCYARAANMEYGEFEGHVEFMVRVNSPIEVPATVASATAAPATVAPAAVAQATEARATEARATQARATAAQATAAQATAAQATAASATGAQATGA
ncbi:sodium/potassium-transporting ATPase subunit beta-1-like [Ptychodera flava]|uniref:sodium/potassium-transporting ATPase subunit beta-1-like n=1 Tax=Ptychodera flava TaxID=63121 RepID=UPI00396A97F0